MCSCSRLCCVACCCWPVRRAALWRVGSPAAASPLLPAVARFPGASHVLLVSCLSPSWPWVCGWPCPGLPRGSQLGLPWDGGRVCGVFRFCFAGCPCRLDVPYCSRLCAGGRRNAVVRGSSGPVRAVRSSLGLHYVARPAPPAAFVIARQWIRWRRTDLWSLLASGPRPAATQRVRCLKGREDCNPQDKAAGGTEWLLCCADC